MMTGQMISKRASSFLRLAFVMALVGVWVMPTSQAEAFRSEPHGWAQYKWGTTAESALRSNKEWRARYKMGQVKKILKTQDVIFTSQTELAGRTASAQWIFGKNGLHTVVLSWEGTGPDAHRAYKDVLASLETTWGTSDPGDGGSKVWEGKWTRAEAKRVRMAMSSGVEVRLSALPGAFGDRPAGDNPTVGGQKGNQGNKTNSNKPPKDKKPIIDDDNDDVLGLD